jgi:single-strand DNA-binding protein
MNINHFIVSGNDTRDPELRYLTGGKAVVTFNVACNYVWRTEDGEKHERADFFPVTTFGRQAERDAKYLRKGTPVTAEGRMESWYDAEKKKGGFNFIARNVEYGGRGTGPAGGEEPIGQAEDEWLRAYNGTDQGMKPAG